MARDPRHLDLLKQGFMRIGQRKRPPAVPKPIVACDDCANWHRQGKHTASAAERLANRAVSK